MRIAGVNLFLKLFLMMFLFTPFLSANGISAGGMMSVYNDGPFNAVKNPALLTRTHSSFGVFLYGSPYAKGESTLLKITGLNDGNSKTDSYKKFNSNFSLVKSLEKISFGFSLASQDDDHNYYSKKTSGSYYGKDTFSKKEKSNAVGMYLSTAYKINSAYSIGVRLYSSYKKEKTEENESQTNETFKEKNTDSFAINPAFGFHMISRRNKIELGLILSGGTFIKNNTDYNFKRSDGKSGDDSYSSGFEMVKSPSVTLGILKRFARSSFSAETVFYIPSEYDSKEFSVDESLGLITKKDSRCKNTFRIDQRLGYEYLISRSSAVSCGVGFLQIRQKNDLSTKTESREDRVDAKAFIFSMGFDKKISPRTKFIVASSNYVIFNKLELKSDALSIKIKSYEFIPNIMFAVVHKF